MEKETNTQSMLDGAAGLIGKAKIDNPAVATPGAAVPGAAVGAPVVVKTPLGTQTYGGLPVADVKLASFADVQAFAKDFVGAEIKEVQDFVPIFTELKTAKEKASQADQLQKTLDNYVSNLNSLPKDITILMNAAISGEDHLPLLQKMQQRVTFDYSKPFEKQDTLKLINHYTGKQYTKETFDALTPDSQEVLSDSVKLKFETDRNELINFETNNLKAMEQRQEKFKSSVESSIANMLVSNPQMGKPEVERVRQIMQTGLSDALFNKDKTYTPEAAEKIAYMEFGKATVAAQAETIGDIVKRMTNAGVTQEIGKTLLKSDKPPVQAGAPSSNLIAAAVEAATSFLKKK